MLKRLRTEHPILYCIGAELVFLLGMFLWSFVVIVPIYLGWFGAVGEDEYFQMLISEVMGIFLAWLLLRKTERQNLLRRRGCGFLDGLTVGMYPLWLLTASLCSSTLYGSLDQFRAPWQIILFLISMYSVGIAEEMLFRGVVAQTLLEHFGTSTAGIWKATVLSGVLFGAAHLTNLLNSEPFGVLIQCISATVLGMLLAAIYFRTGNLWVVIFIHAYTDIAGLWISGVYGDGSFSSTVSSYDWSNLYSCVIYLIPTIFLLRRKKIPEIQLYFEEECQPKGETE
jgi:hypothetical protein